MNEQEPMNTQESKKKSNSVIKIIAIILGILFIITILSTFFLATIGAILVPKLLNSIGEKAEIPNYAIHDLKAYVPYNWEEHNNYRVSTTGNCRVIGGTVTYDQDRTERILINDELEHEQRIINGINMSYGYKDNGKEKIYSYFFEDENNKYFILFINKTNSDQECDSYIEKLERSITFEKEL